MSILARFSKGRQAFYKYIGIGFVKSRKSDSEIMDICSEIYKYASKKETKLLDIVVYRCDDIGMENKTDIKRKAIDDLLNWMKKEYVEVIFVRDIKEIAMKEEQLYYFLSEAKNMGVSIHSIKEGLDETIDEIDTE